MLIVCPNCSTSYEVKTEAIGDAGRTVRCTRCREEWFATTPSLQTATAATADSVPTAAASDDDIDWDMSEQSPPAPAAADINVADEESSLADENSDALQDLPQAPAPPLAPEDSETIEAGPSPSDAKTEISASSRRRPIRLRRLDRVELPLAPTLIAVQFAVICAGLLWRNEIVHLMPQTASFFRAVGFGVNIRGLAFADVRTSREALGDVTVLVVEGAIVNTTHGALSVPRLRFALRDAASAELLSWTAPPDRGTLGAGERLPFRSHLASPPAGGSDILVRFLNRQDLANGAH